MHRAKAGGITRDRYRYTHTNENRKSVNENNWERSIAKVYFPVRDISLPVSKLAKLYFLLVIADCTQIISNQHLSLNPITLFIDSTHFSVNANRLKYPWKTWWRIWYSNLVLGQTKNVTILKSTLYEINET